MHHRVTRRTFLTDLGKGAFALVVFGPILAACADDDAGRPARSTGTEPPATGTAQATNAPTTAAATTTSATGAPVTTGGATTAQPDPSATTRPPQASVHRVDLGPVSAYVLARGAEAAVVDTGVAGSAPEIAAGLAEIGLGWNDVGSVILTHLHPDHIGSVGDVMAAAAAADGHAGAADLPRIGSPRPLHAVGDGDVVFGLDIVDTPGHTPGHISVLDRAAGILVAGDALNGADGGVAGPNPRYTSDMATALESVRKLAGFSYGTAVFGHGDPVTEGASDLVAALAAGLP